MLLLHADRNGTGEEDLRPYIELALTAFGFQLLNLGGEAIGGLLPYKAVLRSGALEGLRIGGVASEVSMGPSAVRLVMFQSKMEDLALFSRFLASVLSSVRWP